MDMIALADLATMHKDGKITREGFERLMKRWPGSYDLPYSLYSINSR